MFLVSCLETWLPPAGLSCSIHQTRVPEEAGHFTMHTWPFLLVSLQGDVTRPSTEHITYTIRPTSDVSDHVFLAEQNVGI